VLAVPTLNCFVCGRHVGHPRYENVFRCLRAATYLAGKPAPAAVFTIMLRQYALATLVDMSLQCASSGGWANTEGGARPYLDRTRDTDYAVRKFSRNAPAAGIVVCLLTDPKLISSAFRQGKEPPRSPKATVEAFANPRIAPGASSGTNAISRGSGVK
jgi:hypothetical protein